MRTRTWLLLGAIVVPVALLVPSVEAEDLPAPAKEPACVSITEDTTDPEFLRFLEGATLVSTGRSEVTYTSDGTKISRGRFVYEDQNGKLVEAEHVCTSSCASCGIMGCDSQSWGCTGCDCVGNNCGSCTCTKTSVEVELSN